MRAFFLAPGFWAEKTPRMANGKAIGLQQSDSMTRVARDSLVNCRSIQLGFSFRAGTVGGVNCRRRSAMTKNLLGNGLAVTDPRTFPGPHHPAAESRVR